MVTRHEQLMEIERLLRKQRTQLDAELREDVERARGEEYAELAGPVTDVGDQASADLLADLDNAEIARDVRTLRELEAALQRFADGSYGKCVDCGGEIAFERLRAYPTATRCASCQSVHEKTFTHPSEPRL